MKTFQYVVTLKVEVEAFDEADAFDALQDEIAIGEVGAVTITECEYE